MADGNSVRRRVHVETDSDKKTTPHKLPTNNTKTGLGIVTILKAVILTLALSTALSWFITGDSFLWGWKPWWSHAGAVRSWIKGPVCLTEDELIDYNGSDPRKPIYLALNGTIYDVSAGQKTYGPGGSYHFFAGRDAARAFLTGCFEEDLTSDLRGVEKMYIPQDDAVADTKLSKRELKLRREKETRSAKKQVKDGIENWAKVFRGETGRPYFAVGKIKKETDSLAKLPVKQLCEAAEQGRPKREETVEQSQ